MKILIVDDNSYNRDLLNFILEDLNHEYVNAEDGQQAVNLVQQDDSIDLILMDVMMPVMDGFEATRQIKKYLSDRFMPVLFVTSLDDEKNIAACLESGGDDFVPKPVNEKILVAKLSAHARSKKLYDKLHEANDELRYHRQLIDREHSIIRHIFKNAEDRVKTKCDNIELYTSPMSMFNGDLTLTSPSPSGGAYCLIGDFTGHGLAASIGSLPLTEVFFQYVARQASVAQIARAINKRLEALLPSNMFFCAAIIELDRLGEMMTLWLGGMNDMLCFDDLNGSLQRIESDHMPLGILGDDEFDDSPKMLPLSPQMRLYVYSDGVTETCNDERDTLFGQDRLEEILKNNRKDAIASVISALSDFNSGNEQSDDVSIVEIFSGEIVHRYKDSGECVDVSHFYHSTESIPWRLDIELMDDDLKSTSIVDQIMSFVSSIQGIELHQDKVFTIVSELYNNSLDHGVLNLQSSLKSDADGFQRYYTLRAERLNDLKDQFIKIKFEYLHGEPNQLRLNISDSGKGFDSDAILKKEVNEDDMNHGRGLQLLRCLCSNLDYSDRGRTVTAIYDLCEH